MMPEPSNLLLEHFPNGGQDACANIFSSYEAYLRALVRRQLPNCFRAKFDSADVVQSAWVHVLRDIKKSGRHFDNPDHLRAFLILVTRHRLTDRMRRFRRNVVETPDALLSAPSERAAAGPRPSEVARANDLWQRLLGLSAPEHHELLRLRRQGMRLREIAARTGLHEDSVRRVIRKLARALATAEQKDPAAKA
jgi:RNA polymerase sigma factor (sigma-70 family)